MENIYRRQIDSYSGVYFRVIDGWLIQKLTQISIRESAKISCFFLSDTAFTPPPLVAGPLRKELFLQLP